MDDDRMPVNTTVTTEAKPAAPPKAPRRAHRAHKPPSAPKATVTPVDPDTLSWITYNVHGKQYRTSVADYHRKGLG